MKSPFSPGELIAPANITCEELAIHFAQALERLDTPEATECAFVLRNSNLEVGLGANAIAEAIEILHFASPPDCVFSNGDGEDPWTFHEDPQP